jgi:phosphohistidine phosphatase SixA
MTSMSRLARAIAVVSILLLPGQVLAQRAVFVARHAEKASDANEASVPLSPAGATRANRLAELLKDAGITAVYSTDTVRTRKTAEPLANLVHAPVRIYEATTSEGRVDLQAFAAKLRHDHAKDSVLVVGHSNTIAPLLSALGCREPVSIPAEAYDNLFIVLPQASGPPVVLRLHY